MRLFRTAALVPTITSKLAGETPLEKNTGYIEVYRRSTNSELFQIDIVSANHKSRYCGQNVYSRENALRAAKLLSRQTSLKVVDTAKARR